MKLLNLRCWQPIENFVTTVWAKQNTSASQTASRDLGFVISGENHQLASPRRWMFWALACTLNQPCAVGRNCEHHSLQGKTCQHLLCVQFSYLPRCSVQRKLFGDKNVFMEVDGLQQPRAHPISFLALSSPSQPYSTEILD